MAATCRCALSQSASPGGGAFGLTWRPQPPPGSVECQPRLISEFSGSPAVLQPGLTRPSPALPDRTRAPRLLRQPWEPRAAASPRSCSCSCCRYADPATRFAVPFCLLPSRFPSSKKVGVQGARLPWRLRGAGLSAVVWEGGSGGRGVAASRAPSQVGGSPRCGLLGPRAAPGPRLLKGTEGAWSRMGACA